MPSACLASLRSILIRFSRVQFLLEFSAAAVGAAGSRHHGLFVMVWLIDRSLDGRESARERGRKGFLMTVSTAYLSDSADFNGFQRTYNVHYNHARGLTVGFSLTNLLAEST